jgi:predicted RNA-binding Zn ribbon-like protein
LHFAPDTEDSLEFVVALGNTDPGASRSGDDELVTPDQLADLLSRNIYTGRVDHDEVELDGDAAVVKVNAMLSSARAMPQLVCHDGIDWHMHATAPDAPLAERIRVEASLAIIDVIRMNEMERLRVCEADDCTGLFLDLSRNGSKRFCSVRCGNRMNMIAFRERKAQQG